ncbi:MAG TPA: hypothetical protein VN026_04940 [Bacteroidia bacterium]|jgi:hypothetical protein|nr:hypothetical protein [Bacteroidia bacterium]
MKWIRKGLVYKPELKTEWSQSHAQVPFGFPINENTLRIYFATRDKKSRSVPTFIEVDSEDPRNIKYIHDNYCLSLGALGMHDESGVMPSCFIRVEDKIYMYYTGWNIGGNVSYRAAIGLAISEDNGITFKRYSDGPIIDRSVFDPCFACQPFVLKTDSIWKMWYISCTKWEMINNHPEPYYHVKYAESNDGINWERKGLISLDYDKETDAIGNPTVLYEKGLYKMFYSYRKADGYRVDPISGYKLGYAESVDGIKFIPKNNEIEMTGKREDWEEIMNAYPHVLTCSGKLIMLYNGNGFGNSGFGYAINE